MERKTITETEKSVRVHIHAVQLKMYRLISLLMQRCENHDASKLREPEKSGFEAMDREPRYKYGTPEYFDKLERFSWVLEEHYKNNSHHPEHYQGFITEMDLLDVMEMLVDWVSYKDTLTTTDAIDIMERQARRYGIEEPLYSIMLNTLTRYLSDNSCASPSEEEGTLEEVEEDDEYGLKSLLKPNITRNDLRKFINDGSIVL